MATPFTTGMYVLGLLVCGSLNTITMKIAFTMKGINADGEERIFQKPWFITFVMFVAMTTALLFDKSMFKKTSSLQDQLIDKAAPSVAGPAMKWSTKVKMVSIPAVFDILATGLCSMGFLYIPASVWQLLRGAEMVFAAFFAVTCLGRKLWFFHWLGVLLCTCGIIAVGLASVWGAPTEGEGDAGAGGTDTLLFGMSLALGGQVVQAAQVIAEEWLLTDMDLPGLQIVGFEGFWGTIIMVVVAFPALYFLPGEDRGHLEDDVDAACMVWSRWSLLIMMLLYTFSCATYNMSGIAVTGALSAVHRVMLEAFRTSIVWVFGLCVHYFYDRESKFGESWTPWSWLEVCGFIILMLGQAVFGEMIRIPCLKYPESAPAPKPLVTPGNLRVLTTPLPQK